MLTAVKNFEWEKIGSFTRGDPYTIAFVYPYKKDPFVLKGGSTKIKEFLEGYKTPNITHYTFWKHGRKRNFVRIHLNNKIFLYFNENTGKVLHTTKKKWSLRYSGETIKNFRRIPRKWVKELNQYIKEPT